MAIHIERERKFLVRDTDFLAGHTPTAIAQGYLVITEDVELRVRVAGQTATLTIKSGDSHVARDELEYALPVGELAVALLYSTPWRIAKNRFDVVVGDHVWQVDVFQDTNQGLVIAEVEFEEGDTVMIPEWAGAEVTGDDRFYNRTLAQKPFGAP